jgi:C1A family cysteine protease
MKLFFNLNIQKIQKCLCKISRNLAVLLAVICFSLQGDEVDLDHPTGLIPFSPEEVAKIEQTWPKLLGVKPNVYGVGRIQAHLGELGISIGGFTAIGENEEEFITNQNAPLALTDHKALMAAITLPAAVDNSKLICFPPIGDQRQQGSCVGWASTYYHATHEYGLLNSINNKNNFQNTCSPKWTYNMLNGGQDAGAYPTDAYALLSINGATSITNFPYNTDYREWDLSTNDWISALSYRMTPAQFFFIEAPADLQVLKELLNNGHVATFVTYAYSWQYTKVKADPAQSSNPYAGQNAISWMNGFSGGHHVTIVGYDDNVWIDVNGNGVVDPGEKGAFLMANSWGSGWGNNGYMWIAYDAFYANSTVANGPTNRAPIAQMLFSTKAKSANYTPQAVAKFSLSQAVRNQLSMGLGVSDVTATAPTKKITSAALTGDGGAFSFNGQSPQLQTATFVLDLTDLLPSQSVAQKYYLMTGDLTAGNPTTLNSYSILDLVNNTETSYQGGPLVVDRSAVSPDIIFQLSPNEDNIPPSLTITSPADAATVSGNVTVTVNAQDNVGVTHVNFYVDTIFAQTNLAAPFIHQMDTTQYSNGPHTIGAVAYDAAGNSTLETITVTVQNTDTEPPKVKVSSPVSGSTVKGVVNFNAIATDNIGVKKVAFYVDSILQSTDSASPYSVSLDTTKFSNGQHTLKVIGYDTSNNVSEHSITVNVQNLDNGPTLSITSPLNGAYVGGSVLARVQVLNDRPIDRVELHLDCEPVAVDRVFPYAFLIDTQALAPGQHVLTAVAYDDDGRSNQSAVIIYVQN